VIGTAKTNLRNNARATCKTELQNASDSDKQNMAIHYDEKGCSQFMCTCKGKTRKERNTSAIPPTRHHKPSLARLLSPAGGPAAGEGTVMRRRANGVCYSRRGGHGTPFHKDPLPSKLHDESGAAPNDGNYNSYPKKEPQYIENGA